MARDGRLRVNLIEADTSAEAWEKSLVGFANPSLTLQDGGAIGGPFIELPNTVLSIRSPTLQPLVSEHYQYKHTLFRFFEHDGREFREATELEERLRAWPNSDGPINQIDRAIETLRSSPGSRRAVVSFWNPAIDLFSDEAIAPSWAQFRIAPVGNESRLNLSVMSRSCDAWIGCPVDLVAFASLLEFVGRRLDVRVGRLVHHTVSYHLYQYDLPSVQASLL